MKSSWASRRLDRRVAMDYAVIIGAGLLYAAALKYFVLPSSVILTGTEGIAAALSYYFDAYWLFVLLYGAFQAALLSFAKLRMPPTFARRSLVTVATVIVALMLLPSLRFAAPEPENERILLVLFGGLLAGTAKAMAFRRRGSTGDEDILGAYFAMKYLKPVGSIAVIAAVFSTAFGMLMALLKHGEFEPVINTLMYTCIYIFASAETLNNLYHRFSLTAVDVVSHRSKQVGQAIVSSLPHRTFIVQDGRGGHSSEKFDLVRTVVTKEELPTLLRAVNRADPDSFHYHFELQGISRRYYIPPIGDSLDSKPHRTGVSGSGSEPESHRASKTEASATDGQAVDSSPSHSRSSSPTPPDAGMGSGEA
ncbi:MAG: YitT family protein [Acidimicrobiia bacterium]|nr:YitT family protein [Acidimicrobiia bacterium]